MWGDTLVGSSVRHTMLHRDCTAHIQSARLRHQHTAAHAHEPHRAHSSQTLGLATHHIGRGSAARMLQCFIVNNTYAPSRSFCAGYVSDVLEDAVVYSDHAGKNRVDVDDVRLAIQGRVNFSFTGPPPREVCGGTQ